jgi:hypothetical protein
MEEDKDGEAEQTTEMDICLPDRSLVICHHPFALQEISAG